MDAQEVQEPRPYQVTEIIAPVASEGLCSRYDTITGSIGGPEFRGRCSPREFKQQVVSCGLAQGALTVIFVRHGRSFANERETILENSELSSLFQEIPNHLFPLTDRGAQQAYAAGRHLAHMLRSGFIPPIDQVICSPFTRTQQTLSHLIQGAHAYCEQHNLASNCLFENEGDARVEQWNWVRERHWADFERLNPAEQAQEYEKRTRDPFFWIPTGAASGEAISDVVTRASIFMHAMHRPEFRGKVVLVVIHGEFMNAIELAIRRLDPFSPDFARSFKRGIPNCGIMMISRVEFKTEMSAWPGILGGFSQELRAVPYALSEAQTGAFSDWCAPHWREINKQMRATVGDFEPRPVSEDVAEFVKQAGAAGIGKGKAKPHV